MDITCGVCYEPYKAIVGDHYPRLLQCGHTFCSACIHKLLVNYQVECPFDKKKCNAYQTEAFRPNYLCIDLLSVNRKKKCVCYNFEVFPVNSQANLESVNQYCVDNYNIKKGDVVKVGIYNYYIFDGNRLSDYHIGILKCPALSEFPLDYWSDLVVGNRVAINLKPFEEEICQNIVMNIDEKASSYSVVSYFRYIDRVYRIETPKRRAVTVIGDIYKSIITDIFIDEVRNRSKCRTTEFNLSMNTMIMMDFTGLNYDKIMTLDELAKWL